MWCTPDTGDGTGTGTDADTDTDTDTDTGRMGSTEECACARVCVLQSRTPYSEETSSWAVGGDSSSRRLLPRAYLFRVLACIPEPSQEPLFSSF